MILFWLTGFLLFLVGTAVGSFLNLVVYRSKIGQEWIHSRSVCEKCNNQLAWQENIPLFSYFFLKGKCSHCKSKIDTSHPMVELLTGVVFLLWFAAAFSIFSLTGPLRLIQLVFWLLVALVSMIIFIADFRYMIIPRWTVVTLTIATLLYRVVLVFSGQFLLADLLWSIVWSLGLAAFFLLLWLLTKGKGFGFGDVQLAIPLGLLLGGWQRVLVAFFLSFLSGALLGVVLIALKKKKFGQTIAFGPFLLLGTLFSLLWGYEIWGWYVTIIGGAAL